jgi:protein phosphatase methylesterase 1
MPPKPTKVNHGIFPKPPQAAGGFSTGSGMGLGQSAGKKLGLDFNPVDGRTLWDSIDYLEDGTPIYFKGKESCIFFCIHGAGHSALSFTILAQELQEFASVLSYDIRGHGYSKHPDGEADLSINTLVADANYVINEAVKKYPNSTFVILGHSLGGSIACRLAKQLEKSPIAERIVSLISVDVVEGTALEYLPFMAEVINKRPKSFPSMQDAIRWIVHSKTVLNLESAKISIPPQLRENPNGSGEVVWKNELLKSEKFWTDWFKGLSSTFLESRFSKICFIAARERLDKELEIANMQGKFRLVSFPNVGHCMLEDDPVSAAKYCHMVLDRFKCPLSLDDVKKVKEKGIPSFHSGLKPYSKGTAY